LNFVEIGGVRISTVDLEKLKTSSRQYSDLKTKDKILFLRNLATTLEKEFPTELANPKNPQVSDVTILQQLIYKAIQVYENNELLCVSDESNITLNIESVDLMSNQNVQIVRRVVSNGISEISDRYHDYNARMRIQVKKLKAGLGYGFMREALGHGASLYQNMFVPGKEDLIIKNP
jgi:hypothetical protein